MGNILTACSSKKHFDKVDDFIHVSAHGKVIVEDKVETVIENVVESVVDNIVEKIDEKINEKVDEINKL